MMKNVLLKGVCTCLFTLLFGSLFAQTGSNSDFVEIGEPIFSCDFQNPTFVTKNFIVHDEDKLTPTSFMSSIGFSVGVPWVPTLRDTNESVNIYAGSTSSYNPAGQANDWLVTTGIVIPTEGYILKWKSQAFDLNKRDGLKVFISTTGQQISDFPKTPVFELEQESAGPTENADGEWVEHSVKLDAYAGQTVYIAFVNQSNDKSILLLDDILVLFNGGYIIKNISEEIVDNSTSQLAIKGELTVTGDKPINAFDAFYKGADGVTRTLTLSGLNLKEGESKTFEFPEKLNLETGKTTKYQLWVHVNGEINQGLNSSVASLTFKPERKIVIEEGTGAWCGACPTGIVAFEHLHKIYGDKIIPIAIHQNDSYHMGDYINHFGFIYYPAGYVNRKYYGSPMSKTLDFLGEPLEGEGTFKSLAEKSMTELSLASIKLKGNYTNSEKKIVNINTEVKFALDMENADYRLSYVVREEYLKESQSNYYSTSTNPNMGEWGKGGQYGKEKVNVYYTEVARAVIGDLNGITELIPSSIQASKLYSHSFSLDLSKGIVNPENVSIVVMLLDGKTGEIVNADMVYLGVPVMPSGINEVSQEEQVSIFVSGSDVQIYFNAQAGNVISTLCSIDGKVLDTTQQNSSMDNKMTLSSNGYRGVALLKLNLNGQTIVKKVIL